MAARVDSKRVIRQTTFGTRSGKLPLALGCLLLCRMQLLVERRDPRLMFGKCLDSSGLTPKRIVDFDLTPLGAQDLASLFDPAVATTCFRECGNDVL